MQMKHALRASALAGFTILAAHLAAQGPQTAPPAPAPALSRRRPPADAAGPRRRPGDVSGAAAAAGDPKTIARGKGLYTINCTRVSRRGSARRRYRRAQPAPLRSVVLNDQDGELILPVVRGAACRACGCPRCRSPKTTSRRSPSTFIASPSPRGQGSPPATRGRRPIVVGDAGAGGSTSRPNAASAIRRPAT